MSYQSGPSGVSLVSKVHAPAGSLLCDITAHVLQPHATWRSIQTSATTHTELRSALLYLNHSCRPSLELHVYPPNQQGLYSQSLDSPSNASPTPTTAPSVGPAGELRVARDRALQPGDDLTFFYPSTEWKFDRDFECLCGAAECVGTLRGASGLDERTLERYFVNEHILQLRRSGNSEESV